MSNAVVRRANQVVYDLASWVIKKPGYPYNSDERHLIVDHYNEIAELFDAFRLVGAGRFLYSKETVPVRLVDKDGKSTLLVVGPLSEHVFNTRVLNANARAVNVLKSVLLPSMATAKELQTIPVANFGVLVAYSSEEFGTDGSLWPEYLVFVAPVEACRKFASAAITDRELLDAADVFVADRDMKGSYRKTKLSIE